MVRNRKETTEKSKKKLGLSTQIFIALLAGALLGVVIHYWIDPVQLYQGHRHRRRCAVCHRTGLYPPDADACRTACLLLPRLRKYVHRRQQNPRKGRRKNDQLLFFLYQSFVLLR